MLINKEVDDDGMGGWLTDHVAETLSKLEEMKGDSDE